MNRIRRAAAVLGFKAPRGFRSLIHKLVAVVVAVMGLTLNAGIASANTVGNASVGLSDPRPSQTSVTYTFTGGSGGASTQFQSAAILCIKVEVATTSTGSTVPTGFSAASASVVAGSSTLINSSSTGWTPTAAAGSFTYTHSTGVTPSTTSGATFTLGGLTNSSTADTGFYYRLNTYGNTNCSSSPLDSAIVTFINTNGSTLSLTVDNALSFSVGAVASGQSCDGTTTTAASTATTLPFGTVTSGSNAVVCQDLTAATNATGGYTIYGRYTAKPTNALSQTINDHTGTNASPTTFTAAGTEAYGYTTNDTTLGTGTANRFTSGGQKWAAMTTSNAELAYESAGVTSTSYRVGHQVGVSLTTRPGTYTTTIIYTCTPVY